MTKHKILFVCLGNICRSPMAEAIFKHKINKLGIAGEFEVDSCGTSNYHIGESPDSRTIENARENKIPIQHQARQLTESDLDHYDLILAMDNSNLSDIFNLSSSERNRSKIKLMREYDDLYPDAEVPDPYFGGKKGFQDVFDILDRSCKNLLRSLTSTGQA